MRKKRVSALLLLAGVYFCEVAALQAASVPAGEGKLPSAYKPCKLPPVDGALGEGLMVLGQHPVTDNEIAARDAQRHAQWSKLIECLRQDLYALAPKPPDIAPQIERILVQLDALDGELEAYETKVDVAIRQIDRIQIELRDLRVDGGDIQPGLAEALKQHADALKELAESGGKGGGTGAPPPNPPPPPQQPDPGNDGKPAIQQIDPVDPVSIYFDRYEQIAFAIASVPDPRVPRHGRAYDNDIAAITAGMLKAGYVLDRYNFPWQEVLQRRRNGVADYTLTMADDGKFGLMIFRRDTWRRGATTAHRQPNIAAIYVVPETASSGVARDGLSCAIRRIADQLSPTEAQDGAKKRKPLSGAAWRLRTGSVKAARGCDDIKPIGKAEPKMALAEHPKCQTDNAVVVLGPHFSGSLDSLAQVARRVVGKDSPIGGICTVSGTATATSNERINELRMVPFEDDEQRQILEYHSLAVPDAFKLDALSRFVSGRLHVEAGKVAFLVESSVFGLEACSKEARLDICQQGYLISFPANIADVRYRLRKQRQEDLAKLPQEFRPSRERLELEEGAENGSEFPDAQQSPLTDVAVEMQLRSALDQLAGSGARVVVIVATDVRDRLFLFDQVRTVLPDALLVDIETDRLLSHVDFIHASRGAMTLASAKLTSEWQPSGFGIGRRPATWANDGQSLLACAAFSLVRPRDEPPPRIAAIGKRAEEPGFDCSAWYWDGASPVHIQAHVVTRRGLKLLPGLLDKDQARILPAAWAAALGVAVLGLLFLLYQFSARRHRWLPPLSLVSDPQYLPRVQRLALLIVATSIVALAAATAAQSEPLLRLGWHPLRGLGLYWVALLALGVIGLVWIAGNTMAAGAHDNDRLVGSLFQWPERGVYRRYKLRHVSHPVLAFYLLWIAIVSNAGLRPSVFGATASWMALLSLATTTYAGFHFMGMGLKSLCRLRAILFDIRRATPAASNGDTQSSGVTTQVEVLGSLDFASTPMLASVSDLGVEASHGGALQRPLVTRPGAPGHLATYLLLAREITMIRHAAICAFLCGFAAVMMVFLFPTTAGDQFLLVNLGLLLASSLGSGFALVAMERNQTLSSVLCNAPATLKWSIPLLAAIAAPAVGVVLAFGIAEAPGVMTWGGGVISRLLEWAYPVLGR